MAFERHSRLKYGRFGSGETEFELSANHSCLDEPRSGFPHEEIKEPDGHSDDPTRETVHSNSSLNLSQLNVIGEVVNLRLSKFIFKN